MVSHGQVDLFSKEPVPTRQLAPAGADMPARQVDRFVHARLATAGVAPGPEADAATLEPGLYGEQ